MSIGSNLSGITFSGVSSGIDSESIISRLLALERQPITRMRQQQTQIQSRQAVLVALRGQVSNLNTAAAALNTATAFSSVSASSSKTETATITAGPNAQPGTYSLSVTQLAQAQKVATTAQSSAEAALNMSGNFVVNGKEIDVVASDTLTSLARKINDAQVGVTASVLNGGTGNTFLTITANKTGLENRIQISDLTGTVARSLGLVSSADPSFRSPVAGGASSFKFSSDTTPVGELMGTVGMTGRTVNLNDTLYSINLQTMSLQDIAQTINGSPSGATATVRNETVDGTTRYWLEITGISLLNTEDNGNVLGALGVLQRNYGNQIVAAQDAQYSLDGISLTSATNTVQNVIPDATITLLKGNSTTPETSTLTLATNDKEIMDRVNRFKDAYNAVVDFIKNNSSFDKETFQGGPLLGDPIARQVEESIANTIFQQVTGLSGAYDSLIDLGFGFADGGKLTLNETTLQNALNTNREAVSAVFRAMGDGSTDFIEFTSGTDKTKPSGSTGYAVNITQLATKGSYTSEIAQTGTSTEGEWLTFNGGLFGNAEYRFFLSSGRTQAQVAAAINGDARLKDLVSATIEAGRLKIESKRYGTTGNFTVVSDRPATTTNSGIGTTQAGVLVSGVDVAGTIGGETATGNGQFLIGNAGNANTDGLQIRYSGVTTGAVGSVTYTRGIGAAFQALSSSFTDTVNGLFTANDQALQQQVDSISDQIESLNERLALREQALREQFSRMEETISRLQGQQARIAAMRGTS